MEEKRVVSTESALALWEPRECVKLGSSPPPLRLPRGSVQIRAAVGQERGCWGHKSLLLVPSLHRVESCALVLFKHHNFSPLKDTFKNACAF